MDLHIGKSGSKVDSSMNLNANFQWFVAQVEDVFFLFIGIKHAHRFISCGDGSDICRLTASFREEAGAGKGNCKAFDSILFCLFAGENLGITFGDVAV